MVGLLAGLVAAMPVFVAAVVKLVAGFVAAVIVLVAVRLGVQHFGFVAAVVGRVAFWVCSSCVCDCSGWVTM